MKSDQRRLNQEAAGIPDSKPFVSEQPVETGESRILACHINGVLVRDMNLPPQVVAALDYWQSDEGIGERNANPMAREASGVQLGPDQWNKTLEQKRDDVKERGMTTYEARDPFREVADRHAVAGMRPKFLRGSAVRDGSSDPDYEIVKEANGEPVKVRGMVLGHIPEELAQKRLKFYSERGNAILKQIGETYKREGGQTAVADQ